MIWFNYFGLLFCLVAQKVLCQFREGSRIFCSWSVAIIYHALVANHSRNLTLRFLTLDTVSISQDCIRAIVVYEWRHGTGATNDSRSKHQRTLGEDTTSIKTVNRWFACFREGETDFERKPPSGCHTEDSEICTRSLATRLGCTHPVALSRLQDPGYRRALTRWIPHVWTDSTQFVRISV